MDFNIYSIPPQKKCWLSLVSVGRPSLSDKLVEHGLLLESVDHSRRTELFAGLFVRW